VSVKNEELRRVGLKITLPRIKILEILETSPKHHLSAEDVYRGLMDSGTDIGLATVYRVLSQFETAGIVQRHNFEGGHSVFELNRGDSHHDHLVCVKCGHVDEFLDEEIEGRKKILAAEAGYQITDHSLIIYGICKDCQQAKERS